MCCKAFIRGPELRMPPHMPTYCRAAEIKETSMSGAAEQLKKKQYWQRSLACSCKPPTGWLFRGFFCPFPFLPQISSGTEGTVTGATVVHKR